MPIKEPGKLEFKFTGKVWLWKGKGAWHFITIPADVASGLRFAGVGAPGFGMIRVKVAIGTSNWSTSVFPDAESGSFLLPIKADIRKAEKLANGSDAKVTLSISV